MSSTQIAYAVFFGTAIISWSVMSEMELFERFYRFSRDHEDWDVDELAMLIVNLALALMFSNIYQANRQRHLLRCVKQEHGRAEHVARHDSLTGLYNRRALTEIMDDTAARLDRSGPRYIAMLDLDRFKPINDLRGHAIGDATLTGVARRLGDLLSPHCVLARLGGDEFAIVFREGMTDHEVERAARSLLRTFEDAFRFDRVVVRREGDARSHWYFAGDRLLALDAMDDARAYMVGKRLIEMGRSPSPEAVADPGTDLKSLLKA